MAVTKKRPRKRGRKPLGKTAMTAAERQRKRRAKLKAAAQGRALMDAWDAAGPDVQGNFLLELRRQWERFRPAQLRERRARATDYAELKATEGDAWARYLWRTRQRNDPPPRFEPASWRIVRWPQGAPPVIRPVPQTRRQLRAALQAAIHAARVARDKRLMAALDRRSGD